MNGVDLIITVTDRNRSGVFSAWFQAQGIPLALTVLGRGTATGAILDYLGLEATEKAVLLCPVARSPKLVRQAARELWLDVPGSGILMSVPMDGIGGPAAQAYLTQEQEGAEPMERETSHSLILVIAEAGGAEQVMDAARGAGATGGTILHAKGTGTELAKKFFGVSIAAEKELILILAQRADRSPIMRAILASGEGPRPLVCSLPVSEVAGLRALDNE